MGIILRMCRLLCDPISHFFQCLRFTSSAAPFSFIRVGATVMTKVFIQPFRRNLMCYTFVLMLTRTRALVDLWLTNPSANNTVHSLCLLELFILTPPTICFLIGRCPCHNLWPESADAVIQVQWCAFWRDYIFYLLLFESLFCNMTYRCISFVFSFSTMYKFTRNIYLWRWKVIHFHSFFLFLYIFNLF